MIVRFQGKVAVSVAFVLAVCSLLGGISFFTKPSNERVQRVEKKAVCAPDPKLIDSLRSRELPDVEDFCPEPTQPPASGIIEPAALEAAEAIKGPDAVAKIRNDFGSPAVYSNGRLPAAILCRINSYQSLRCDAARSWIALRSRIYRFTGVYITPCGGACAYRDLAGQYRVRAAACARGRCFMAAVPGTSNHGLGIAVDVATPTMERAIDRFGAPFGWLKRCSDASFEHWHYKYAPACTGASFKPTVRRQCNRKKIARHRAARRKDFRQAKRARARGAKRTRRRNLRSARHHLRVIRRERHRC